MDTVSVKMVSEENEKNKLGVSRKIEIIPWKVCTNNFSSCVGMHQKNELVNTVNKWYKCYMFPYRAELRKKNLVSTDPSPSE